MYIMYIILVFFFTITENTFADFFLILINFIIFIFDTCNMYVLYCFIQNEFQYYFSEIII
jgi:hypothetical protein